MVQVQLGRAVLDKPGAAGPHSSACSLVSAKRPSSMALSCQESTEPQSREVRRGSWDVCVFEFPSESFTSSLRELFVEVTDHLPVVAKELRWTMHNVAKKHRPFCPVRNDNYGAARRMARGAVCVDAGQDRLVLSPRLKPVQNRGKQLRRHPTTHQRDGQTVVKRVDAHEKVPVRLVTSVGCVSEKSLFSVRSPAQVVEMKMGQHDVGDFGRVDSLGGQVSHECPCALRISIWANPGIDEHKMFTTTQEESAELNGQHAI